MALKRPPTHAADAEPRFIWARDSAWDTEKIDRERAELPKGEHPVDQYLAGETRYDLDAPMTVGGQSVTVRSYLNGTEPTVFYLRRVSGRSWLAASGRLTDDFARAMWDIAAEGLTKIVDGIDKGEPWNLEGVGSLTEDDMQLVFDVSAALVQDIGLAVYRASKPLTVAEGKR